MSAATDRQLAGMRPVVGPSALGTDTARFWRLTWTLAVTQFRLKFYGSVLGYLWQIMRPLMIFGVLYLVFTKAIRIGEAAPFFPVVLLSGIVLFTFLSEALTSNVTSLVEREPLLRKIEFPRMAIPCSVVLTALMNLGLNLLVVVVFAIAAGVDPSWRLIEVPFILLTLAALALGLGLLVSSLYVRYRDVSPVTDVVLQMTFYGSAIIFPLEALPEGARPWLMLNPVACIVQQMRHAGIDPTAPSAFEAGGWRVAVAGAIVVAIVLLGLVVFRRRAPYVAEDL